MGSKQEHNEANSPFKKGDADAAASVSESPNLSEEAARLLKEKQDLIRESQQRIEYPGLNAMAARATYFGLQGRLFPSMSQVENVLSKGGPVGEATLERMNALKAKGWSFGSISLSDPYLTSQAESTLGRMKYGLVLGGYNDAVAGKIAHNPLQTMVNTIMGLNNGADRDIAVRYAHELAHGKYQSGYSQYESTPEARKTLEKLSPDLQTLHGQEMVREETRAIAAQVAANAHLRGEGILASQSKGINSLPLESSMRQGQVGALVKDAWKYEGTKFLNTAEANAVANEHIKNSYGELFENGKLNPRAEQAIAAEMLRLPIEPPVSPIAATAETAFSSSRYFNYLSRGGQALGTLGALTALSDVHNQFRISTGSGAGRLLSVGSDWAGFEAGTAVGGWLGEGVTSMLVKSNPRLAMIALPFFSIGSGIISSQIMHDRISKPLEIEAKEKIDKLISDKR